MSKVRARAVLVDGKPYQKKADGSLVPLKGKTDWKRLDRMTSTQVEAIAASDSQGKGYQTRINTILRRYYETHRKAG